MRGSLDREALLVEREEAATRYIANLENELAAVKAVRDADAVKVANLEAQVVTAKEEAAMLRGAIENYKASAQALKEAVAIRDAEVIRLNEKVKAANKRTIYAAIGSALLTVLMFLRK